MYTIHLLRRQVATIVIQLSNSPSILLGPISRFIPSWIFYIHPEEYILAMNPRNFPNYLSSFETSLQLIIYSLRSKFSYFTEFLLRSQYSFAINQSDSMTNFVLNFYQMLHLSCSFDFLKLVLINLTRWAQKPS
jgi:hypothetical protein